MTRFIRHVEFHFKSCLQLGEGIGDYDGFHWSQDRQLGGPVTSQARNLQPVTSERTLADLPGSKCPYLLICDFLPNLT